MSSYRSDATRLAAAAAVVHEFLHAFENLSNQYAPVVNSGNQSLKSYGWMFGETNLNRPKNLELLIEASCSLIRQLRYEIPSARIPAAKMFLCRYSREEAYSPGCSA